MSVETGKVCCNCRHDIRQYLEDGHVHNYCDVEHKYMGYVEVMEGWCRHWAKEIGEEQ